MKIRYLILQTVIVHGACLSPNVTDYDLVSDEANVIFDWIKIFKLFKKEIFEKHITNIIKTNILKQMSGRRTKISKKRFFKKTHRFSFLALHS